MSRSEPCRVGIGGPVGAGKTTLALHIATAAEAAGLSAAIIDLDPQASAAGWGDSRQGEAPVVVALPHTRLPQGLQAATDGGAELVVIDTAPHSEAAWRMAGISSSLSPGISGATLTPVGTPLRARLSMALRRCSGREVRGSMAAVSSRRRLVIERVTWARCKDANSPSRSRSRVTR